MEEEEAHHYTATSCRLLKAHHCRTVIINILPFVAICVDHLKYWPINKFGPISTLDALYPACSSVI
jgi:hypothetical protein